MKPFPGVWVLDPALSQYGEQPAPRSGLYTLVPDGDQLDFHIRWTDADGIDHAAAFTTCPDGREHPLPGRPDATMSCTITPRDTLTTTVTVGGTVIHTARRVVSGDTMTITQQAPGSAAQVSVYRRSPIKQVLVYRRDLKMRKGKIAAQVAHASMRVFFQRGAASGGQMTVNLTPAMSLWVQGRFTKVVLSVESEADLLAIHQAAISAGLPAALITDSGKTEFGGVPTRTTVAVGPASAHEIDPITGRDGVVVTKLA